MVLMTMFLSYSYSFPLLRLICDRLIKVLMMIVLDNLHNQFYPARLLDLSIVKHRADGFFITDSPDRLG